MRGARRTTRQTGRTRGVEGERKHDGYERENTATRRKKVEKGKGQKETDRQTDRETDRQTDREKDRQTERQTDRQTDREKDRQTDRQKSDLTNFGR